MSMLMALAANRLRRRLSGIEGDSSDPTSNPTVDPTGSTDSSTTQFQMPGFWRSLIDHKLGIDELAPLKAQLLDTQIKEQQMKNARFGIDAQHQDAIFGLTQGEMQAKNLGADLANTITKSTMANKIEESGLALEEKKTNILESDQRRAEAKARGGYYSALTQEQQMKTAQALGEASAGSTQIGPQDVDALTKSFVDNAGIDPSQKGMATTIYQKVIGGALAQKQQQLGALKQTNDMVAQQKRIDDMSKLLNLASNSSDPAATVEGAGKFLGLDADTINFAKQAAGTMKQAMVTPREDSYTKSKGEELQAAEGVRRNILSENSTDGTVNGLSSKYKTRFDKQTAIVDGIRQELDNYQQNATSRQIPKKGVITSANKGNPGTNSVAAAVSSQNATLNKGLGNPASLPDQITLAREEDYPIIAKRFGITVDQLKAEVARRNATSSHDEGQ